MPDQIPEAEKHRRAAALASLEKGIRLSLLEEVAAAHPVCRVLFESFDGKTALGHTDQFIEVRVPSDKDLHGMFLPVRLCGVEEDPSFEYGSVCNGTVVY